MPRSPTPVGSPRRGLRGFAPTFARGDVAFRYFDGVGSHDMDFSGLHHAACTFTVYASQPGSPLDHARLASGWWPSLAGQDSNLLGPCTRFRLCYDLHRFLLTQA